MKERSFWKALVFERDNDLNLSWFLLSLYSFTGVLLVIWTVIVKPETHLSIQIASITFLGSAFLALLVAAVPLAKAKILAAMKKEEK